MKDLYEENKFFKFELNEFKDKQRRRKEKVNLRPLEKDKFYTIFFKFKFNKVIKELSLQ